MIVTDVIKLHGTDREANCPNEGFKSIRMLVKSDGLGFTMTRTTIYPTKDYQQWQYKKHMEACYCIKGRGVLKEPDGTTHTIKPGIMYAPGNGKHYFKATKGTCILICVFNPPLIGNEVISYD